MRRVFSKIKITRLITAMKPVYQNQHENSGSVVVRLRELRIIPSEIVPKVPNQKVSNTIFLTELNVRFKDAHFNAIGK